MNIDREQFKAVVRDVRRIVANLDVLVETELAIHKQPLERREALHLAMYGVADQLRAAGNMLDRSAGRNPAPDTLSRNEKPEPNEDMRLFRTAYERARSTNCPLFHPDTDFSRAASLQTSMQYTIWFLGQMVENLELGEP
jgi:hypothetical protein